MKKLINVFTIAMLLLTLGSCTKENSLQNSFSGVSATNNSVPLCLPNGIVEILYGVNSPVATVRITYDASYSGTVTIRRNNSSGTVVTSGNVSLNPLGQAFVSFQLARGRTYHSRLLTNQVLCLIDNTFYVPALVENPQPCIGCPPGGL
jgi:hypothetical protein